MFNLCFKFGIAKRVRSLRVRTGRRQRHECARGRRIKRRLIRRSSPARYHLSCPNARWYKPLPKTLTANQSVVEIETIGMVDPISDLSEFNLICKLIFFVF